MRTRMINRNLLFASMVCVVLVLAARGCSPAPGGNTNQNGVADGNANDNATANENGNVNENGDGGGAGRIVADHHAADAFDDIPMDYIQTAQADYRIFYGHTSHGSQILAGLDMIYQADSAYAYSTDGSSGLAFRDEEGVDLGYEGDTAWADDTRDVLDEPGSDINMVMWSWCAGVSDNTEEGIDAYCEAMDQLERDYPEVVFVYMTGHLDGSGQEGTLRVGNNQIRQYCEDNNKILFDFADIESYDPDGNYYADGSDWCEWCTDWCASHTCPTSDCVDDDHCQHSQCFNCYRKGQAFWWMMARIAGWGDSGGDGGPTDDGGPAQGGREAERLHSADINYEGAFRLPEDFNWGALGMSFYPGGDGGNGSLLVTGFELVHDPANLGACWNASWDCNAYFAEVTIPAPATEANWEDLPQATMLTSMIDFDQGLASTVSREYVNVSDIEYVPQRGSQTGDKLYGSLNVWYAEGAFGSDTFPTIWISNMDGSNAQGMFHVGPESDPHHGRKMGSYLFSVPEWYADDYLGGRTLVTGRARGTPLEGYEPVSTDGGSQGPTLFAFAAFDSDTASGDLDALPILYYRVAFPGCAGPNVGTDAACDYPTYTMCDDWTGAAFVDNGSQRAIMMLGYVGLGENCYDEPPVVCNDPCSDSHGYHCQPYERQVIFYDVHELGYSATGGQNPWVVQPYETWQPGEFYLYESGDICSNSGGMTFDADGERIFMVERGLGGIDTNATVVHVFSL